MIHRSALASNGVEGGILAKCDDGVVNDAKGRVRIKWKEQVVMVQGE
jgi:hypothetical protein